MRAKISKQIINGFKNILNWFISRSFLTKLILILLTLFILLPNIFIWTLYHTRYSLPQENGFSLEGRSALIQRENKLYIYNWTKPDNTLFGIQNKYTETLIKDYTNKQFPLNTAILPNNLINEAKFF